MVGKERVSGRSARGSKRARVLEVAARTLNRFGVSNASLPNVAQQLGVSRAALYYYFEDQEDLVFQSYRRSCEVLAERLAAATQTGHDAVSRIDAFIDGVLSSDQPEIAAISDLAYLAEDRRATILGLLGAIKADLAGILEEGVAAGTLRPCSAGIVATAILGLVSWVPTARYWRGSRSVAHDELIAAMKAMLHKGIAADRSATFEIQALRIPQSELPVGNVFDAAALAAAKQESLLATASWLFNIKGVDATSLDEVAARLGVTKKVIYHNLGDKETLVAECYRRSFRFYQDVTRQAAAMKTTRIEAIIATTFAYVEANLHEDVAPLAPITGIEALSEAVQEEINTTSAWLMEAFAGFYEEGQREGSIAPVNAKAILAVNPGSFNWLPKWYEALTPEERARAPRELAELNQVGLLAI